MGRANTEKMRGPGSTMALLAKLGNPTDADIRMMGSGTGMSDADREYAAKSKTNRAVRNVVKDLGSGSGVSDADREYMQKATSRRGGK